MDAEFHEVANEIAKNSLYQRKESEERTIMTVHEMGDLLGIKKTDRYWLLHKGFFKTKVVLGKTWIDIASFDKWYASQSRYRTRADREKDLAAEAATITMPEMARLLGTTRSTVYSILNNPNYKEFFDFVVIADKKRITKESFQRFLDGHDRYHLDARNEYTEVAAEENMALADFRRKKLFKSGVRRGNGNKNYLTRAEAAMLAKVSKPTIDYWANQGHYTILKIGELVRIPRAEFEDWLNYRENMEAN